MNKKTKLLGQEKMSKTLLIMGIPTMVGMLVSALYNIVDAYYVSKIGKLALAAVTVVNPLSYIGMFVGLMFGCGGNAVIARAFGAGKKEEAKQVSATAIFAGLGTIAVFIISILLFLNPVLKILGAIQDYHELAVEYAVIFTIGLFFNVFNMCMNNMIVAEGNSVVSMTAMFVGAIVNILLDPILIFALDMGVFGAGMATLIARMVSSVIYIFYVCKKESIMSLNPMDVRVQANFFKSVLVVLITRLSFPFIYILVFTA